MKYSVWLLLPFLTVLLNSCEIKQAKMDAEAVNREIKDKKVRRLKDADISQRAYDIGKSILNQTITSIDSPFINKTVRLSVLPDSLQPMVSEIRVVCDSTAIEDEKEKELWAAVVYSARNNHSISEMGIQRMRDDGLILFPTVLNQSQPAMLSIVLRKKAIIQSMYR